MIYDDVSECDSVDYPDEDDDIFEVLECDCRNCLRGVAPCHWDTTAFMAEMEDESDEDLQ